MKFQTRGASPQSVFRILAGGGARVTDREALEPYEREALGPPVKERSVVLISDQKRRPKAKRRKR